MYDAPGLALASTWIRYSDFNSDPPVIVEFTSHDLGTPLGPER
jgi:hypothetical protein